MIDIDNLEIPVVASLKDDIIQFIEQMDIGRAIALDWKKKIEDAGFEVASIDYKIVKED